MHRPILDENEEKKEEGPVLRPPLDFFSDAISHIDDYFYRTPEVKYPGDDPEPLLDERFLLALTPEGRDQLHLDTHEKPTFIARRRFLNYLKDYKFLTYTPPNSRKISLEDFIGEKGVKLYIKALIEEMHSKKFRDAFFLKSISTIDGELGEFNTKRIIWIGGPSSVGKTKACDAVLKLLASKLQKTGDKQEIAVASDGGIIRKTSQMRSIVARLAEKMGFSIIKDLHTITDKVFDQCKGTKVRAKVCVAEAAFASNLNIIKSETFTKSCPELAEYEDRIRKSNLNYRQVFVQIKKQAVKNRESVAKDLEDNLVNHVNALQDLANRVFLRKDLTKQYPDLENKLQELKDKLEKFRTDAIFKNKLIDEEIKERRRRFKDSIYRQGNFRAEATNFDPEYLKNYPVVPNLPPVGEHKAYSERGREAGVFMTRIRGRDTYEELYQDDPDKISITIRVDTTFVGIVKGEVKEVERNFEDEALRINVRLLNAWNIYWDTLRKDEKEKFSTDELKMEALKHWVKNIADPELTAQLIDVKETELSDEMDYSKYLDRLIGFDPHVTIPPNIQLTKDLAEYFDNLATYDKTALKNFIDKSVVFASSRLSVASLLNYAESKGFDVNFKAGDPMYIKLQNKRDLTVEEKNQFLSDVKQHLFEQMIERQREYKKNAFEIKLSLCFKKGSNNEYQVDESQFKIKDLMQQYPEYLSSSNMHFALQNRKWLDFMSRPTLADASQKALAEATIQTVEEAIGSNLAKGVLGSNARITLYKKEPHHVERKFLTGVYQLRVSSSKEFEAKLPAIATAHKKTQPTLVIDTEKNLSSLKAGEYAINFIENIDTSSKSGYFVEQAISKPDGKIKIQSTAQRLPPEINKTNIFSKALNELCNNNSLLIHHKADIVKIARKLKLKSKDLFNTLQENNEIDVSGLKPKDINLLETLSLNIDTIKKTLLKAYYQACGVEINGHTLPSPAYLNYVRKQCESLQPDKSSKIIKILPQSNEDPMLMRAYVMVCTAKGWKFKNECTSLKDEKESFANFCQIDLVKNYVIENISLDEPFHKPEPVISPAPGSVAL